MIKCEYCTRASIKLQSNCDGCGAALPISQDVMRSMTAPVLLYNPAAISPQDAQLLGQPGRNIPIRSDILLSALEGAASVAIAMFPR